MAEGLTEAELTEMLAPQQSQWFPGYADHDERARDAIGEAYRRHRIPRNTPLNEAAAMIEQRAQSSGSTPSAWANPEEWAAARESYAREGKTPAEINKRWEESQYLLDPRTYEYMQKYGRDADMLAGLSDYEQVRGADDSLAETPAEYDPTGIGDWQGMAKAVEAGYAQSKKDTALSHWNSSRDARLARPGLGSANYQRYGGLSGSLANAITNPDVPVGNYMTFSETVPNYLRMTGSGEADNESQAWEAAQAMRLAQNRYRLTAPSPILDTDDPKNIPSRMAQLQREVLLAAAPDADERWQRTQGWTPPGWVTQPLDFLISSADPTIAVPFAKGAGALTNAYRAALKASRIAGKGWGAHAVKKAVLPFAADVGSDQAVEHAVGTGIMAAIGGSPGRSWDQFQYGGGEKGKDFFYKDDEQLAEAQQARKDIHGRLKDDAGVSTAEREAYNRMRADGTLPNPPAFYWGMSPSGPAY